MSGNNKMNYYGKYREISDEDIRNGVELRWGGHYQCGPQYGIDRIHKRYMLGYIEKGVCLYGGREIIELHAGDLFFYKPNEHQYIKSTENNPITYYGTCFSGEFMDSFINRTALLNISVLNLGLHKDILDNFNKLIEDFMLEQSTWHILGTLMHLISCINDKCTNDDSENAGLRKNPEVVKVAEYIRLNYKKKICVDDLALMSGYSASRFQYLFRELYGVSLTEWKSNKDSANPTI